MLMKAVEDVQDFVGQTCFRCFFQAISEKVTVSNHSLRIIQSRSEFTQREKLGVSSTGGYSRRFSLSIITSKKGAVSCTIINWMSITHRTYRYLSDSYKTTPFIEYGTTQLLVWCRNNQIEYHSHNAHRHPRRHARTHARFLTS